MPAGVVFDQRGEGYDRVLGNSVDMGSFELLSEASSDVAAIVRDTANYGRVLFLTGGAADDQIRLFTSPWGSIRVSPDASTTINGSADASYFRDVDNIKLDLGAGDDTVIATGTFFGGGMRVLLGDGDDTLVLKCEALDVLQVDAGSGNDTVRLNHVLVTGDMLIRTGTGEDNLTLKRAAILGSTNINLGEDDDKLKVVDSLFGGDALADGGLGDDLLTLLGDNLFLAGRKAKSFETVIR